MCIDYMYLVFFCSHVFCFIIFQKILCLFLTVSLCVFVCGYVYMSAGIHGSQKNVLDAWSYMWI